MRAIEPRDFALLLGITLLWGFNLIASKVGVAELPPIFFTFLRFAILAVVLAPLLRIRSGRMGALVATALLAGGLHFALMFIGIRLAGSVSSVAIASQLGVPFATLLSVVVLDEVVRWRRWAGIVLAFVGVIIMGFDPDVLVHWQSIGFVVASAFVGALGMIAVKKLTDFRPLELQAWIAWVSWPLLLGLSLPLERPSLDALAAVSPLAWAALGYTAIASSLVAQTGFYHLISRYPVTSVAPLTVLSPVFSVAFGVWLLGDRLTAQIVAGGICTLAGVLIITLRERRIPETGS